MVGRNTEETLQWWLLVFSKPQVAWTSSVISSLIKSELGGNQFGVLQMKRMQDLIVPAAVEYFSELCYLTEQMAVGLPLCLIWIRGFMNSLELRTCIHFFPLPLLQCQLWCELW